MTPLKNRWPCCQKPTRLHGIEKHHEGDVIEKRCPHDRQWWQIKFVKTSIKEMPDLLKMEWEKIE